VREEEKKIEGGWERDFTLSKIARVFRADDEKNLKSKQTLLASETRETNQQPSWISFVTNLKKEKRKKEICLRIFNHENMFLFLKN